MDSPPRPMMRPTILSGTMIISEVGTSGPPPPPPPGAAPGMPGTPAGAPGPFSAAIIMSNLFLESGPSPPTAVGSMPMGRFSDGGGPPSDGPGLILDAICLALSRAEAKAGFLAAASSADPAEVLPGNSLLMLHSEQTDSTHLYTHSRLHPTKRHLEQDLKVV